MLSLLVSAIMGIFCSSGCGMNKVAYGMPHADYKISGTVVSSVHELPIKGLLITMRDTMSSYGNLDSTKSDSLGRSSLERSGYPRDSTWDLSVIDIDSTENGSFASKDTIISIPKSELKDGDAPWYWGHGEKNVDIKLDNKE